MKVILVDDERSTRNLIRKLVDWDSLGVDMLFEAADGQEAIEIIGKEKPQVIITDMHMPMKDGVSFLQWLQENPYLNKKIVVSGYTEYYYMQKTIQYSGYDYLVKPVDEEKLTDVLKRAIASLNEEQIAQTEMIKAELWKKRVSSTYWSHLITELIDHPKIFPNVKYKLYEELGLEDHPYVVAILCFDPEAEIVTNEFQGQIDLLYFSLLNIINEILAAPEQGIACRYLSRFGQIILILRYESQYVENCQKIAQALIQTLHIDIEITVSSIIFNLERIPEAFHQAEEVYQQRNLLASNTKSIYTVENIVKTNLISLMDYSNNLKYALLGDNKKTIEAIADKVMDPIEKAGILQRKQLELWDQECIILANQHHPGIEDVYRKIQWISLGNISLINLRKYLKDALIQLAELANNYLEAERSIIYEIRNYLEQNYAVDLKIKDLAKTFHMNPEYMSRLFRQKFNLSIKDYLIITRIDKAKILLTSKKLKINEIASLVGFNDEKYFSKVFRKYMGMRPKEYRENYFKTI